MISGHSIVVTMIDAPVLRTAPMYGAVNTQRAAECVGVDARVLLEWERSKVVSPNAGKHGLEWDEITIVAACAVQALRIVSGRTDEPLSSDILGAAKAAAASAAAVPEHIEEGGSIMVVTGASAHRMTKPEGAPQLEEVYVLPSELFAHLWNR